MKKGRDSSVCLPIKSSSTKNFSSGDRRETRALIYPAGSSPEPFLGEESPGMGEFPVFVEQPSVTIDPSWLDFSKTYTVEHNAKVRNVGRVDRKRLKTLQTTFDKAVEANVLEGTEPLLPIKARESSDSLDKRVISTKDPLRSSEPLRSGKA